MKKVYTIFGIIVKVVSFAGKILPIFNKKHKLDKVITISDQVKEVTDAIEAEQGCTTN